MKAMVRKPKTLRERLRSKRGFATEYAVIVLLVLAAVVGLIMVFGGNLRNMFSAVNEATSARTLDDVNKVDDTLNSNRDSLSAKNKEALENSNNTGGVTVSEGSSGDAE